MPESDPTVMLGRVLGFTLCFVLLVMVALVTIHVGGLGAYVFGAILGCVLLTGMANTLRR